MGKAVKYNNKKITVSGQTFDSKKEYNRWMELKRLEDAHRILHLERQVKFVLLPAQYEESTEVYKKGAHKGERKPGKLLENKVVYIADFVYQQDGKTVVEDSKGFKTPEYKLKRKLMLYIHGIKIKET